jgi:phosphomannomutase
MLKGDVLLGAEESGGIGFPGHIPERDGVAAGLTLLNCLPASGCPLTGCRRSWKNGSERIATEELTLTILWNNARR